MNRAGLGLGLGVWLGGWLGLGAVVVALSRVLLVPDGPWEQDEAIFAAAVIDYDIVQHRPHPPGFPGWIALGKLAAPLVGDPLLALRLLSCAASVATFVLLAILLRKLVPPVVALAAAGLHAFTPTVWFHAPRAFADTPAIALALAAVAAWTSARPRVVGLGWVLLAWATLVRPQLLPVFAVLAVVGAVRLHRVGRLRAVHLVGAAALGLAVLLVVVVDTGGVARLAASSTQHFETHERATGLRARVADLGLVRGFGGLTASIAWAGVAIAGLAVLARRNRLLAATELGLVVTTLVVLLGWHASTFPRYQVLAVVVLVPLVAVAAERVGPRIGATVLALATLASARFTAPALVAAHTHPLPLVAGLRDAGGRDDVDTLVLTRGSVPFARLARMTGELSTQLVDSNDDEILARLARPFLHLTPVAPLPGVTVVDTLHAEFPAAAWDLSQRRYDRIHVVDRAVLHHDGVARIEHDGEGEPFAWLAPQATLWAQPGAEALALVLVVPPELAPMQLHAAAQGGERATLDLAKGINLVHVPLACATACAVELEFSNSLVTEADARVLAARLYGAWCEGATFPVPAYAWSPGTRMHAAAHGVTLEGVYGAETFTRGKRPGAWTNGRARAEFPAGPGILTITLANPAPRRGVVTLRTDAEERTVEVANALSSHEIPVTGANGRAFLDILGDTRVPAEQDAAKTDTRRLGQVLIEVRYTPIE